MTVATNTQNRKVLAQELARLTGETVKYLGMPSCAYSIGPYTIERDGSISGESLDAIHSFLVENGYIEEPDGDDVDGNTQQLDEVTVTQNDTSPVVEAVSSQNETRLSEESDDSLEGVQPREPFDELRIGIPIAGMTVQSLTILLKMLYSRQTLLAAMVGSDRIRIDEELVTRLDEEKPGTIDEIEKMLENETRSGFVAGICIENGSFLLDFPFDESKPTEWETYGTLMFAMNDRAKQARHTNVKKIDPAPEEMKYFCHSWLMQLGMGGPEHKGHRHVLLDHLTGYAAFRSREKMNAHKTRRAEKRREMREAQENVKATEVSDND